MSVLETSSPPALGTPLHRHPYPVEEFLYILGGKGLETVGDERREVGPGSAVFIQPEVEYSPVNIGDEMLILLVVVSPPGIVEKKLYLKKLKKVTRVWEKEYV
jgi:mannose-6-phosphate isomerase-like protein (cupin superfamily)